MQDENKILLGNWLNKSDTALDDTKKNIEINSLETAQNRLYYAIFYAVSALAKSEGNARQEGAWNLPRELFVLTN